MAHWVAAGATAAVLSVVSGTADWPTACNLQQEEQLPIRTTCNRFLHCLCCSTTTNCCAVSIYFLFVLTKLYLFLGYDKTESLLPAKTKKDSLRTYSSSSTCISTSRSTLRFHLFIFLSCLLILRTVWDYFSQIEYWILILFTP
jgi:hypothetical protein